MGIELGLPPDVDPKLADDMVQAAAGELPLIVRVPMEKARALAEALAESPLTAISLAPPRGVLLDKQGQPVGGRLFGPAVYPLALGSVLELVEFGLPVIAAGGVYDPGQVEVLLEAGAIGVQLDAVLWGLGWPGSGGDGAGLSFHLNRARTIVGDLDQHMSAEFSILSWDTLLVQETYEAFDQRPGDLWMGGIGERGPAPFAGIGVQCELRDNERTPTNIQQREVHFVVLVLEDP